MTGRRDSTNDMKTLLERACEGSHRPW